MRRAEASLTLNIKEIWLTCFPEENKRFIDHFFNDVFEPTNTIIEIQDNKVVSCVSTVAQEVMINDRVLKASTILGAATLPRYQGRGYVDNILKQICSNLDHTELISFATAKNPELLEKYGFRTIYKRNCFELTRDDVQRITNDGCLFDPSAQDMLNIYTTFVRRFNGFKVRSLEDFENYKKSINDRGGKVVAFYENNLIRGYASFTIENKVLHIEECTYLDTLSLFKLLNVALQQRHIVYLYVSQAEKLNPLSERAKHTVIDYKMARLNNKELYNRLYGTNIDVIEEVFLSNPKPPFTSELY
mgnify:CR=1 FL=1